MARRVVPTAFPTDPQLTTPDEFGAAVRAARTASGLTHEIYEAMTEERHSALVRQLFDLVRLMQPHVQFVGGIGPVGIVEKRLTQKTRLRRRPERGFVKSLRVGQRSMGLDEAGNGRFIVRLAELGEEAAQVVYLEIHLVVLLVPTATDVVSGVPRA